MVATNKKDKTFIAIIWTLLIALVLWVTVKPVYASELKENKELTVDEEETEEPEDEPEEPEDEDTPSEEGDSIADSVREEAENMEEESTEEASPSEGLHDDSADGLDGEIVDVITLSSSERNNCQLSITGSFPEGFDANCYVQIQSEKTGTIYNFPLYNDNHYYQRGNIPDGEYRFFDAGVYDDVTGFFVFNPIDSFSLNYGETKSIVVSFQNEQEVIDYINGRMGLDGEATAEDYKFSPSHYDVTHTGTGTGHISAQGTATADYKFIIKVTKSGVPGDMSIAYSTDNGEMYSEPVDIPLSAKWEFANISYIFEVPSIHNADGTITTGQFIEGDTYKVVYWDPADSIIYDNGESVMSATLHDDDPEKNPFYTMQELGITEIEFQFLKDGSPGEAVFAYKTDLTDWSAEMLLPGDGMFHIPETPLYVTFESDSTGGGAELKEGDVFSISLPKDSGLNPLYILIGFLAIVLGGGYFGIYYFFKSKAVSQSVYSIHEYTPVRRNADVKKAEDNRKRGMKR